MKALLYTLLLSTLITSCQKVIDVNLNNANQKIVIEANYTVEDSTARLHLSQTTSYFEPTTPSTLNGATVFIIDGNGVASPLVNVGNGDYVLTNYVPNFNSTYRMTVAYNGITYSASSLLADTLSLKPITYQYSPGILGFGQGYYIELNYDDPAGIANYYCAVLTRNGVEQNKVTDFILGNDQFSDGNSISRPLFLDSLYNIGDTAGLELRTIDAQTYDYYSEIQSIAGQGQSSAAPSNPLSVWDNGALGYFAAYGNSRKTTVIL